MGVVRQFRLLWATYRRTILLYLLIVLLPAGMLLYYYFQRSENILERQVTVSILNSIRQVKINLDYRLSKVDEISDALILNTDLYDQLASDPLAGSHYSQVQEEAKLGNLVRSLQGNDIQKIKLYVNPDKMYAREHVNFFSLDEAKEEPWYEQVMKSNGAVSWIPTRTVSFLGSPGSVRVVSSARIIRDPHQFARIIGILELDVPEANLSAILAPAEYQGTSRSMYVVDSEGLIMSHTQEDQIGNRLLEPDLFDDVRDQASGIRRVTIGNEAYYLIFDTLDENGWKVVSLLPVRLINRTNADFNVGFSVVLILSLVLLVILGAFLVFANVNRSMIARLRHITEQLKERGAVVIEEGLPQRRGVVIRLEKSVTHMLSTLQQLLEDNYRTKEKEKEARLKVLQAQINPHFLYNALDTINWMALTKGAKDISRMLHMLAQYFRLSLSKGKDIVTLEEEMNLAKAYLEIQMQRFHSFEYELTYPESLAGRPLPKLTVQPIIENAILHGIQNKEGHQGRIRLEVFEQDGGFVIRVADDGTGMSEDKVRELLASFSSPTTSTSSYGLYNVWERLRLYTGGAGRLDVASIPGEGTTVSLTFPEGAPSGETSESL
ncbi:cache domain-containing sensor histidine kinase [Cohnella zeiphila]|uniref:Sensor histidine kinase n=1 Tax=Cohnella zeiphila TaxID=2761120 RepID=A0A7X0VY98_9BACL|nr:sensor histidine kinase [Cohnella zeiphila]MBB6734796.1 sensor histidine kinase [Cohnella zeiphila]